MIGTIIYVIVVIGVFLGCVYICNTKDKRIDLIEQEKIKRDRDVLKWL